MMENEDQKVEDTNEQIETAENKEEVSVDLNEKLKQAQNDLLYLKADFDNYRKRILKEQDLSIKTANKNLVSEFVGVIDLFDKALKHSSQLKKNASSEILSFVNGIEMTRHELTLLIGRYGAELLGVQGEKFDPNKHEAISQIPTDEANSDKVIEVFEMGCSLYGRVIKPAKVVVGVLKS